MSRIRKGFETRFRQVLRGLHARRPDEGVAWMLRESARLAQVRGLMEADAMGLVLSQLLRKAGKRRSEIAIWNASEGAGGQAAEGGPVFLCDSGLGGLARWLRAAGYDAIWMPDIADEALIEKARAGGDLLITTDGPMMERCLLRDGAVPALWVPSVWKVKYQLRMVLEALHLPVREARCMACGGRLVAVPKQEVWETIPPRTRVWLDDYYRCERCGKLLWHGTHWRRIQGVLHSVGAGARDERWAEV